MLSTITYFFRLMLIFFLFKKCPDISNYFILNSFFISYLFFNFFFSIFQFSIFQFHKIFSNSKRLFSRNIFVLIVLVFHSYIFTKNFWNIIWKQKLMYSYDFLGNFKLFYYSDFPSLYIPKKFLKNLWKQKYCI